MLGTITAYGVGKFIHVIAVVLAFGPTYAYGFFVAAAERSNPRSVPTVLAGIRMTSRYLVIPMQIVVLAAGIYLVGKGNWDWGSSWVTVGLLSIIVLIGMTHGFFVPQGNRAAELAERDLAAGDTLSAEYEAVSKRLALVGSLAGLLVAVALFFMVVKP